MTKRIFRSICLVTIAVLLAALAVIMGMLYSYFSQLQCSHLQTQTMLTARGVAAVGEEYLQGLDIEHYRITWISTDGTVLFDNRKAGNELENHLAREEIAQALREGYGESTRRSDTLMEEIIYSAQRLPDGTIIRLGMQRHTILTLILGMAQPMILVILAAILLALWLAKRLSHLIVRPLNGLDLDHPMENEGYEEIRPLLTRIRSQQNQLLDQSRELRRTQRELETVIGNMNEGLVLLNDRCTVLTMNPAAARIMGLVRPFVGINFRTLQHAADLEHLLQTALAGFHAEENIPLSGNVYQIDASPVMSGGQVSGLAVLMFDITQKQLAEIQRREFSANVSHELKTPLHAILGYAELMKTGLVHPGDVADFSEKIYTETQRMVRLVEDILRLSRLDEGTAGLPFENADLYRIAEEVVRIQAPAANAAGVNLILSGSPCPIRGIPQLLSGIVTNLCTNAIKYNHPGGIAKISLFREGDFAVLRVSDTGIGIPPEHQERIFERFYRVDKSHSKAVGGTGLGLSIVKHAAAIHSARISLQSSPGEGTVFTVHFPI